MNEERKKTAFIRLLLLFCLHVLKEKNCSARWLPLLYALALYTVSSSSSSSLSSSSLQVLCAWPRSLTNVQCNLKIWKAMQYNTFRVDVVGSIGGGGDGADSDGNDSGKHICP